MIDQAGSSLPTMAVLQLNQAKLLCDIDENGPDPAAFKELHSATDLTLHATKSTAQAIGRIMTKRVVLQHHF